MRFFWVGEGDEKDTQIIRKLCQKDPRLQFSAGTFEEMPEWYKQSDITVIPTLACEGTSLSCIEALASGCAVVSTNVGGLPDLIQDDVNGLLVDARPEPIADAINRLIENEDQRTRLQNTGAETSATFTLPKWRQRWTKVLQFLEWIES